MSQVEGMLPGDLRMFQHKFFRSSLFEFSFKVPKIKQSRTKV